MERLTRRTRAGVKCAYDPFKCKDQYEDGGCGYCAHMDAMMKKLAEYEDTEERIFKKFAGRRGTKEILNSFCVFYDAQTQKANLEEAALVARLILQLPCKIGDVLYMCSCGEIYPFEVRGIETNKYEHMLLLRYDGELAELLFWEFLAGLSKVDVTFFRTKEEAVKALAKRGK